jgi:Uma2 family endonuclease
MSNVYELEMSCDRYTYAEYEEWDEWFRCELIDGMVYMMSVPSVWHQEVTGTIYAELRSVLKGKSCKPYVSPIDVRLFPKDNGSDDDVVQPDVIVVCDASKMADDKACRGAPDIMFEVLSRATKIHDLRIKRDLYKLAGVKEYWVIARDHAIRWIWADGRDEELRFMRVNGVIEMPIETLSVSIDLDV